MKDFIQKWGAALALMGIGVIFVAIVALAGQLQNSNSIHQFDKDLHTGLIRVCEQRINPLLQVQRSQLKRDIKQSKSFDYSKFFPGVPKAQLDALIKAQIQQDKEQLKILKSVNCQKAFPTP